MKSHDNKGKAKQKRQDTSGDSSGTSSEESDSPPMAVVVLVLETIRSKTSRPY